MFFGKRFRGYRGDSFSGLNILVLSIIQNHKEGVTGYDIIQDINEKFKSMWRASPGTIYPLLGRLEDGGFVSSEEIVDENNRQKKIYTLTKIGKEKLREVLKDNLETSMNTLGNYIRTIIETWFPEERKLNRLMTCFPFHCTPYKRKIDEDDYSSENIRRIKRIINDLEYSKERLKNRLKEIKGNLTHFKDILNKLEKKKEANSISIPIVDPKEYKEDY